MGILSMKHVNFKSGVGKIFGRLTNVNYYVRHL